MAASTGINNGSLLGIYDGGILIAYGMSTELGMSMGTRDTTNKSSGGWASNKESTKSWQASGTFLFAEDAAHGFSDLFASYTARTEIVLKIWSGVSGDNWYTGNARITDLSMSGGVEDNQTFSASFTGNGALTEAAS